MLNPFIDLFAQIIQLYIYCIIAWAILSMLISFKVVNRQQHAVMTIMYGLNRICSPALWRIRKLLPNTGTLDLSPIVLLLLLSFLQNAMYHYLYNL